MRKNVTATYFLCSSRAARTILCSSSRIASFLVASETLGARVGVSATAAGGCEFTSFDCQLAFTMSTSTVIATIIPVTPTGLTGFAPHFGHAFAWVLIALPHSLQSISAIFISLFGIGACRIAADVFFRKVVLVLKFRRPGLSQLRSMFQAAAGPAAHACGSRRRREGRFLRSI